MDSFGLWKGKIQGQSTSETQVVFQHCFLKDMMFVFKYQYAIDAIRPNLVTFLAILGEFTMIELAETVKEVRAYLLRNSFEEQSS